MQPARYQLLLDGRRRHLAAAPPTTWRMSPTPPLSGSLHSDSAQHNCTIFTETRDKSVRGADRVRVFTHSVRVSESAPRECPDECAFVSRPPTTRAEKCGGSSEHAAAEKHQGKKTRRGGHETQSQVRPEGGGAPLGQRVTSTGLCGRCPRSKGLKTSRKCKGWGFVYLWASRRQTLKANLRFSKTPGVIFLFCCGGRK